MNEVEFIIIADVQRKREQHDVRSAVGRSRQRVRDLLLQQLQKYDGAQQSTRT